MAKQEGVMAYVERLRQLARARKPKGPKGFTVAEIAEATGRSQDAARVHLHRAMDAGLLEYVGARDAVRMDGQPCHIPVYDFTKKAKKRAAKEKP